MAYMVIVKVPPWRYSNMDRTTEALDTPMSPTIMEYYSNIHLDIDIMFINKIPFLLATS